MADEIEDISSDSSSDGDERKKRTLTAENINIGLDDVSCMKCDEDCPDARNLDCGHAFCLDCIIDEVKVKK